jgi:hypothetical protein
MTVRVDRDCEAFRPAECAEVADHPPTWRRRQSAARRRPSVRNKDGGHCSHDRDGPREQQTRRRPRTPHARAT